MMHTVDSPSNSVLDLKLFHIHLLAEEDMAEDVPMVEHDRGAGRGAGVPGKSAQDIAARVPRLVDLFRDMMAIENMRGIEEYVWDYHLDNDLK